MKLFIFLVCFFAMSCEKKNEVTPSSSHTTQRQLNQTKGAKQFILNEIKISASEKVFKMKGALSDQKIEACLREKLKTSTFFEEKKGNQIDLRITYDILNDNSIKSVVLLAEMVEKGEEGRTFVAGTRSTTNEKRKTLTQLGFHACELLVSRLTDTLEVSLASKTDLIAIIKEEGKDLSVLKIAIQSIRDQNIKTASSDLLPLMAHKDSSISVAAAATLAKFDHVEARLGALELAQSLARDKNPSYIPMIYILAQLGGPEIEEYLKTVASSHEIPRIREVAAEALEKKKSGTSPQRSN